MDEFEKAELERLDRIEKLEQENFERMQKEDNEEKAKFLKENPDFEPDGDFWDSHSCSRYADWYGYCQICGAIVPGTSAYRDEYGCD